MATYTLTPNMNLILPTIGQELSPTWAQDLNNSLILIDQHNHSAGYGTQVTTSGININSDLSFGGYNAIGFRSVRLNSQSAVLSGSNDLNCLSVVSGDLYYNDGSGNKVRITQSGGVAGSPGSISGLSSPASASYSSVASTFTWQSAANTPANMDGASFIFRNLSANSKGLTLNPPAAMGANYSLTLPSLPGATSFMTLDASGNMSSGPATANGIIDANIAANTITPIRMASNFVLSSSCGGFQTQSITPVNITNFSLTVSNPGGRLVEIGLVADGTNQPSYFGLYTGSAYFQVDAYINLYDSTAGTTLDRIEQMLLLSGNNNQTRQAPGVIKFVYNIPDGHTILLTANIGTASSNNLVAVWYCKMYYRIL